MKTRTLPPTVALVVCVAALVAAQAVSVTLPLREGSTRFAVLGDTGTGEKPQYEIGQRVEQYRRSVNFDFAIMLGDNIYGSERPQDFQKKFELPYKPTLDAGVKFYASLGNHDDPNQRFYKPFNMNEERYYTFTKGPIRFFALESSYFDPKQLQWFEKELKASNSDWKVAYFHHPLYSSGAHHGSDTGLRTLMEPLLLKYGVDVVFAGHEHFYERLKPQKGVHYFIAGGSAKLRKGDIRRNSPMTAAGFDTDNSFMVVEVEKNTMFFQAISRTGNTVDSGTIQRTIREKN